MHPLNFFFNDTLRSAFLCLHPRMPPYLVLQESFDGYCLVKNKTVLQNTKLGIVTSATLSKAVQPSVHVEYIYMYIYFRILHK